MKLKLTYRAIIKAELLPIRYILIGKHANGIFSIADFIDCLAVWIATVRQSTGEITMQDRIYSQNVVSLWVIHMAFECDIVEVWQVFR